MAVLSSTEKVFTCPLESCRYESCRDCKGAAHKNLTCAEAKQTKSDIRRRRMEEDMTAALLRTCPNPMCRKPMIKDGGCNKLTCSCGWHMCNVCKQPIDGYKHFCQVFNCTHRNCGKCALYQPTKNIDNQAIKEVKREALKELRALRKSEDSSLKRDRSSAVALKPKSRLRPFNKFLSRRRRKKIEI